MKSILLITLSAVCLAFTPAAVAEDLPPAPPVSENTPAPPAPPAPEAPKTPAARKEDEPDTGLFGNMFGKKSKKQAAAATAEADDLRTQLQAATGRIEQLEAANRSLSAQMAQFNTEWPAIEAALAAGDSQAAALQTEFGQRVAGAVSKSVTHSLTQSGHEPRNLPGPGANKPETVRRAPATDRQGASAVPVHAAQIRQEWAAAGYTPPGLN